MKLVKVSHAVEKPACRGGRLELEYCCIIGVWCLEGVGHAGRMERFERKTGPGGCRGEVDCSRPVAFVVSQIFDDLRRLLLPLTYCRLATQHSASPGIPVLLISAEVPEHRDSSELLTDLLSRGRHPDGPFAHGRMQALLDAVPVGCWSFARKRMACTSGPPSRRRAACRAWAWCARKACWRRWCLTSWRTPRWWSNCAQWRAWACLWIAAR